jgi:hypothetical protein
MRFYGVTPRALAAGRADGVVKLMEWFGGKADGDYVFQKTILKDQALSFGINGEEVAFRARESVPRALNSPTHNLARDKANSPNLQTAQAPH